METIASISTAPGIGGIGIVRMSGEKCFEILNNIFMPRSDGKIKGYSIKYGNIINPDNNKIIDEVLVSYFVSPKSYTKEDMCEINAHGSNIILNEILELLLNNGARLAEPGEFTKRAFLNGRIDLSQAEGIIDLINAKTTQEAKISFHQLEGGLSQKIQEIRKDLLSMMADIEANIDYPEYDLEEVTNANMLKTLHEVKIKLEALQKSFATGKLLKEGIKTVIIGKPNAGKSSLLNAILNEERAIVSKIEGTTRDTIEEMVNLHGIPLKLIDTAGIRNAEDEIEKIGVNKAIQLSEEADLIIAIFDNTKPLEKEDIAILDLLKTKKAIILLNKIDEKDEHLEQVKEIKELNKPILKISAKNKQGLEALYEQILKMFELKEIELNDGNLITNVRHKEHIRKAINYVNEAKNAVEQNLPIDIVSVPVKQILEELSSITGENVSEDIINEIFSKFCLGK